uniref:Uncharacterized protein n=1 Tax=Paulinella chromatophora TaxID=39717 RepID=B1X4B4_PAUCH|nr:hypothetical protein PCC_0342 [Paulinella chromatophora]ACB42783.1 hypothetical protein PCC_0342 [Paulinella chromatophora]
MLPSFPDLDLAFRIECKELSTGIWTDPNKGYKLWHELFRVWLSDLSSELPTIFQAEIYTLGLRLINDTQIQKINRDWRQNDKPTDVLSFAANSAEVFHSMSESNIQLNKLVELGDIIISLESAARQARELNHSLEEELHWLASHGLLHLLGWDHPNEILLNTMLRRQEKLILKLEYKKNSRIDNQC